MVIACCLPASYCRGQVNVAIDLGWGNLYRPGRWTPLYLTTSAPAPRQVNAEIYSPHSGPVAMRIGQSFVVTPTQTTHALYLPLPDLYQLDNATVMLRDARTGKRAIDDAIPLYDSSAAVVRSAPPTSVDLDSIFIGATGRITNRGPLPSELNAHQVMLGYLPPEMAPDVAIGIDALDLLMLNAPDLERFTGEQQRAIADWVRGGGRLMLWPAEAPMAASGPVIDLLPCRFGDNQALTIDPKKLTDAALQPRYGKQRARALQPLPGAQPVEVLNGTATGYARSAGLGQVLVLPFDPLSLHFDSDQKSKDFWLPLMLAAGAVKDEPKPDETAKDAGNNTVNNYYGGNKAWMLTNRRSASIDRILDWIGDVPGAGTFGFGYLAGTMLALMVVVGPVDWFVLKRLGKQPWTWVTTSGWIGLITVSAIYAGHIFKSGDLYYRSVELIDQVDGNVVQTTQFMGIYSPSTTVYPLSFDPEAWVQPATDFSYGGRGSGLNTVDCHQDVQGNQPEALRVNIWNIGLLNSTIRASAPPVLEATLTPYKTDDNKIAIRGTITNRSHSPVTSYALRTSDGMTAMQTTPIAPGATIPIDLLLGGSTDSFAPPPLTDKDGQYMGGYYYANHPQNTEGPDFQTFATLQQSQSERIESLIKSESIAVIYAKYDSFEPPAAMGAQGAIEAHLGFVRALVNLEQ